ncbi:MAG: DNA-binding transcriptional LysR family regulator [Parvicella sp.]
MSLNELGELPLVLREKGSKTRAKLEDIAAASGVELNAIIETEGREAVREIVSANGGVGIVSEAEFGSGDGLRKVPISGEMMVMDEALVHLRERKDSKLIRAFMDVSGDVISR